MSANPPVLFDDRYQQSAEKGVAGGYAPLDSVSVVPIVNLPEATTATKGVIQLSGGTAESPVVASALSATSAASVSGVDFGDFELVSAKDTASGYAGLNSVSRTTKGVDTTDDVIVDDAAKGIVMKDSASPAHYWRLAISVLGVASWTDLGTTKP